jgi:putative DNA primase/helicase
MISTASRASAPIDRIDIERSDRELLEAEIRAAGSTIRGTSCNCPHPDHDDSHPSAAIYCGEDGAWRVKCHSCGFGGDIYDLRAAMQHRDVKAILAEVRAAEKAPYRPAPQPRDAAPDMQAIATRYHAAITDDQLMSLANDLGVSADSLRRLRVGWCEHHRAYSFPMSNHAGEVTGIRLRKGDAKFSEKGSRDGLFIPTHLSGKGPLGIAEGGSDTAAGLDRGIDFIGRSNNSSRACEEMLVKYLRNHPRDEAWIGHDNDPTGSKAAEATLRSAERLANAIVPIVSTVKVFSPPPPCKDLREWCNAGHSADELISLAENTPIWTRTPPETLAEEEPSTHERSASDELIDTDIANAARFVARCGDRLRYCYETGQWFAWNERRWEPDQMGRVMALAKETAKSIFDDAKAADGNRQQSLARWAITSQKRERISAMIELAKPDLAVLVRSLDADPYALNVENGVINLRTGELHPHDPSRLMTKISPVAYVPGAQSARWESFLDQIFANDQELIGYVQRFHGAALTGDANDQLLPVYYGSGANGKSTLLDCISFVMGGYADEAPPDLLIQRHGGDEHPTEIADLMGKRLVIASESEKARKLRVALMKRLTGNAELKARRMRQDYFTFQRTFRLLLVTNNKPRVDEDSDAVWRRLRLIPFNVTIPAAERDPGLLDKLKADAPAVLAWLVQGCLDWQRNGLGDPDAVCAATQDYRAENEPLAEFIASWCVTSPDAWSLSSELRSAYEQFCEENGERPLKGRGFTEALHHVGVSPERRYIGRGWRGIGLLSNTTMTP